MQAGLNRAWEVKSPDQPWLSLIRTRAASLGLVAALGFLLMVSLAVSTGLTALGNYLGSQSAFAPVFLSVLNTVISIVLFSVLFAAIFKVLPDTPIAWRDVRPGRVRHRNPVHRRKIAYRLVSRHDRRQFGLWPRPEP